MFGMLIAISTMGAADTCNFLAPEENDAVDETPAATGSYSYSFTCAGSSTRNTIPIPNRLSDSCKRAWEFYARTYGCNDADRFQEAEQRKRACP